MRTTTGISPIGQTSAQVNSMLVQQISRDSDFNDLLTYSTPEKLFSVQRQLERVVHSFNECVRTPLTDLFRVRLATLTENNAKL